MPAPGIAKLFLLSFLLSGCAQFGKGVTEAILEQEQEDTRACHVEGPASFGLEHLMQAQQREREAGESRRQLKILMVHGIGRHIPGYSGRLTEYLMRALGLDVREKRFKEITVRDPGVSEDRLGLLRISHYTNTAGTRSLLFYELTWSNITDAEKRIIEFDDATEYTFRRASLNAMLKKFFNSHVPDSLVFLGKPQLAILSSVRQSFCWMLHGDWDAYPDQTDGWCDPLDIKHIEQLRDDDIAIVTHSLGSRVTIDTLQYFGDASAGRTDPNLAGAREVLANKEIYLYMLANQLPLLEMGQERAKVRGQIEAHCTPNGAHYGERMLGRLSIYAFSDPNDILSYPIPPKFVEQYLDSRLCPSATNISINVAKTISLFGLGEFADPGEAHTGYDHDERVISLMAHGIGYDGTAEIVKERCTWLKTTEAGF